MDILRKYLLSTAALRSPDDEGGAAPDGGASEATGAAAVPDAGADGAPPTAGNESASDAAPDDKPTHGNKGRKPWYLDRISEESERRIAAEETARQAQQRAANAEALALRLQAGETAPAPQQAQPRAQDIDQEVNRRAQAMRLYDDTLAVKNVGMAAFSDFGETLGILNAIGATNDDFVMDVLAVDKANAHTILDKLAKDPERAAALVGMDSRRRTAELTRMSMTAAPTTDTAKSGKQVSRAPAPAPGIEPSASKAKNWRGDDASDEEFDRGFNDMMTKRSARR